VPLRRLPHVPAVVLLLAVFVASGAWSALRLSATFDETTHLPAGFTYLDRLGFRHNPEHPPLAKMWAALPLLLSGRARAVAASTLLAGCLLSFGLTTPRYLSYFNVFAGGVRGGRHYLVDSNIDWGQDLPALKVWVDARDVKSVDLAYFGTADPKAYGIPYRKVIRVHDFEPAEPSVRPGSGGLLAVSVTLLAGVYLDADGDLAREALRRGLVSGRRIEEWIALRDERVSRGGRFPPLGEWLVASGVLTDGGRREIESGLLSTWMRQVRDTLTPVGRAGDSILIYRMP
jgi:hypothetical protein